MNELTNYQPLLENIKPFCFNVTKYIPIIIQAQKNDRLGRIHYLFEEMQRIIYERTLA